MMGDDLIELRKLLAERLSVGETAYRRGGAPSQRLGAALQLQALVDLADVIMTGGSEIPATTVQPLRHLAMALLGIDRGERDDLLKPPTGEGRRHPPVPAHRTGVRSQAAASMHLLMTGGQSKEKAAASAATAFRKRRTEITGDQVQRWREHAMTQSPDEDLLANRFQRLVAAATAKFPDDPCRAAQFLMRGRKSF
jgi:hypothetical protein